MTCLAGGVCCMLKLKVMPLNSTNPWPGAVQTGVLDLGYGPAPTPPFPTSTAIAKATLGSSPSLSAFAGDTWPSAWTSTNRTFAWVCDSTLGPMGLMELHGDPTAKALTATVVAPDPLDWLSLCAPYHPGTKEDAGNIKSGGMAEVNGTLFLGASCITYGQDSTLFIRQHDITGFVAASSDQGLTWTNVTAVGSFPGRFSAPTFTSCGPGLPCKDPDMDLEWTYVFFTGASYNDWTYWENGDAHFLARVSPDPASIATPEAYQYYCGMSGGVTPRPQWSPDATQAQPVLTFSRMLGQNALHYNAQIGRWLVANYGFVNASGNPSPWHQLSWHTHNTPRRTQLIMLEAPQPWGPWSMFYRDDDFGLKWNGSGGYGTTFPAAYHKPLQGDGTAGMTMLFACGNGDAGCFYQLNYIDVQLQLTPSGIAHALSARAGGRGGGGK
jgi:hypothetical protein